VSLITLLEEHNYALQHGDNAQAVNMMQDIAQLFPPNLSMTSGTLFYVHLYMQWRMPHAHTAHNFEMHVYAENQVHGINIVYRCLFSMFIGFMGRSTDKCTLYNAFLPYHYARCV
jgi:hypothetical protein